MAIAFVPEEKKPKRPRPKLKLVPEHGVTKVARPYQERLIQTVLTAFGDRVKEFLLAACPNAGKTFMSLEIAESMVVLGNLNRVLVLAHGTTVLRDQYRARLAEERPHFKAIDVFIPQELHRKKLRQYDLVIVDEAHQFYGEDCKMNVEILKKVRPKHVLLLTGSPSKFIADGFETGKNMTCFSLQQLQSQEPSAVADVMIECASSAYGIRETDYTDRKEVRADFQYTAPATNATLDQVLKTLTARLKLSGHKLDGTLNRLRFKSVKAGWNTVLGRMRKTIIATPSIDVANQTSSYFTKNGVKCVVSHSRDGGESDTIETFKKDESVRLLIVVNRAQLGFDFSELFNFVDMTGSRNPDRIFQMFCRVVRSSKAEPSHNKLFVKVLSRAFSEIHVRAFMSGVLSLSAQENFEKWNGKGFSLLDIPVEKDDRKRSGKHKDRDGEDEGPEKQIVPTLEPGMLVWGDYFRALEHNPDDPLAVYAYARLGEVVGVKVEDPAGNKAKIVDFFKNTGQCPSHGSKDPEELRLARCLSNYVYRGSMFDPEFEAEIRALGWLSQSEKADGNKAKVIGWLKANPGRAPSRSAKDPEERRIGLCLKFYTKKGRTYDASFVTEARALGWLPQAEKTAFDAKFCLEWPSAHDGYSPSSKSRGATLYHGRTEAQWGGMVGRLKHKNRAFKRQWDSLNVKDSNSKPSKIASAKLHTSKAVVDVCCGTIYPSARDAARLLDLDFTSISQCCTGRSKTTGGHTFRFVAPRARRGGGGPSRAQIDARSLRNSKAVLHLCCGGDIYSSAVEASRALSVGKSNVTRCCTGARKSAAGHTFRYATPEECAK